MKVFVFTSALALFLLAITTSHHPAAATTLPHCEDSRHDMEATYLNTAISPRTEFLCVCAATAGGCPATSVESCLTRPRRLDANGHPLNFPVIAKVQNVPLCIYSLGATNHPADRTNGKPDAYWAQRINLSYKPPSFLTDCKTVQTAGFVVSTITVHRASTTSPRAGSYAIPGVTYALGPLRKYGETQIDRVFIDSVVLEPPGPATDNAHVCAIAVTVKGRSTNTGNNDFVKIFAPSSAGVILANGQWQHGAPLAGMTLTDASGSWTFSTTIDGSTSMQVPLKNALASSLNALDIVVADDSAVTSADLVYSVY